MIAKEGIHYNLVTRLGCRWKCLEFTAQGEKELTIFQRPRITAAFMVGKLGSEFVFNEPEPYVFVEEEIDDAGRIDTQGDGIYQYTEAEEGRIADSQYRERRVREEFEGESRFGWLK